MYEFVDSKLHYSGGEDYTRIYIVSDPALLGVLKKHRTRKEEAVLYLDFRSLVSFEYDEDIPDDVDKGLQHVFENGNKWRDIAILTEEDIHGYDFRLKVLLWFSKHRLDLINNGQVMIQYGAKDCKFLSGVYRSVSMTNKNGEKLDSLKTMVAQPSSIRNVAWNGIGEYCTRYECDFTSYVKQLYDNITNALAVYFQCPDVSDGLLPAQRSLIKELMDVRKHIKTSELLEAAQKANYLPEDVLYSQLIEMVYSPLVDGMGNWGSHISGEPAASSMFTAVKMTDFMQDTICVDSHTANNKGLLSKFPWLLVMGNERRYFRFQDWIDSRHFQHSISEICDAAIDYLNGKEFTLYPENTDGGIFDVSKYNGGSVGGKLIFKVGLEIVNDKKIAIASIPYNICFPMLKKEIYRAVKNGDIQGIKRINYYNEYEKVGARKKGFIGFIYLTGEISPEKVIESLYANTSCQQEFDNAPYVIKDNQIVAMTPAEILKDSVNRTRQIFKDELSERNIKLSTQLVKYELAELMRDKVSDVAARLKVEESFVDYIIDSFSSKGEITSVRSELEKVKTEHWDIDKRLVEYYKDIKEQFGRPRRSRIEGLQ